MELPAVLRQAIDQMLDGVPLGALQQAAAILSQRYRSEMRDGRFHLAEEQAVQAYLAARMPATYAAIRASMEAVAEALPAFEPASLLDAGAGPGSALWAAADCWPGLQRAVLVEASQKVLDAGQRLASGATLPDAEWRIGNLLTGLGDTDRADLVTLSYVLDELAPATIAPLIERLWALANGLLLIVEPGTPAGWKRILEVRSTLIASGAHILAPCAHEARCPLIEPDWCHFSQRVARSKLHRLTKNADVPWEDEKFIYVAASRAPAPVQQARVLAPPRASSGKVELKLCCPDGTARSRLVTRREGSAYKIARKLDWGDTAPLDTEA